MSPSLGLYPGVASKVESQESTGIQGKLSSPPPHVPLSLDLYEIIVDLGSELLEPCVLLCDAFYRQQEPGERKAWFPERHLPGPVMALSHPGRKAKAFVICHPGGALLPSHELPGAVTSTSWVFFHPAAPRHSVQDTQALIGHQHVAQTLPSPLGRLGPPVPSPPANPTFTVNHFSWVHSANNT